MFAVADAEKILRKIDLNYLFVDSKMELYFQKWLGLKRWFHDQLI